MLTTETLKPPRAKTAQPSTEAYARSLGLKSRAAAVAVRNLSAAKRNAVLKRLRASLLDNQKIILRENALDVEAGRVAGLSEALLDRLLLNEKRIASMADGLKSIIAFPDPLGRELDRKVRKDGLEIARVAAPIGTIFFIFESRPNVTVDGGALCFKSGNAVILRGGKEAARSNAALASLFHKALKAEGVTTDAVQLVNTPAREVVDALLADIRHIDLVIPRGGENLIRAVTEKARVPVIKHYKGVCHVYLDATSDPVQAEEIALNAKVQRPGVCNAMETLLWDKRLKPERMRSLLEKLAAAGVELRGDSVTRKLLPGVKAASESDWDEEYLDLVLAVRSVDGVEGAVEHIRKHGTGHTDAIVAKSAKAQKIFLEGVDSSSVMVNASTRFADGGEYGLGAEVGISTDKLHARGPMGMESLTTYRWVVTGKGHVRK